MKRAPVIFIGHGSPMNAIANNEFTQSLNSIRNLYPYPKAILCISAHWMTEGTWLTHQKEPKTIHDFYGFPPALFDVQYPAPGHPELAEALAAKIKEPSLYLDDEMWGLDHGTWSVLRHIYPEADIPVIQLSLDMEKDASYHYELGKQLASLRDEGILIIGSGNIVHNLRVLKWGEDALPYDWAVKFDLWAKTKLEARDFKALISDYENSTEGKLSVPTPEHYYPLLYILGASLESDFLSFHYEEIQNASISMRTFSFSN